MLKVPLSMSVGEDFYLPMQWQFSICGNYFPLPLTGYSFEMQIGIEPFNPGLPSIIDITSAAGQIIISPVEGKVEFNIPRTLVTPYMFGQWKYVIAATNNLNLVERLLHGDFTIEGWC